MMITLKNINAHTGVFEPYCCMVLDTLLAPTLSQQRPMKFVFVAHSTEFFLFFSPQKQYHKLAVNSFNQTIVLKW